MKTSIVKASKFIQGSLALFVLISTFVFVLPVHAGSITLQLAPSVAAVGDTVTAAGFNATPNGEVRLYIGSLPLTSTMADEAGTYSAQFTVPPVARGSQIIVASDVDSLNTTFAFLTVEPRILVTPTAGSFNDRISVRGEGFAAYSAITLWLEGIEVTPTSTPTTDFHGTFETSFNMISIPTGAHAFSAQDSDGNAAKILISVDPRISLRPTSGASNSLVLVYGYGFSASSEFTLFFDSIDITPLGYATTSSDGSFVTAFVVPNVPSGVHSISAYDNVGNVASSPFSVPSAIMSVTPNTISGSSMVTVEGTGFQPDVPVLLYMEDTFTASIYDLMARTENVMPKADGSFQYSFMVPISGAGVYEVAAYQTLGPSLSDMRKVASSTLRIVERASLDAEITAGTVHFRGELAEFYLKTALNGELVDVQIDNATIYSPNGSFERDLTPQVTWVSPGLYRIPYAVSDDALYGTYTLLVEVNLHTDLLEAFGSATGSFAISSFFTTQTAQLLDIQNGIATVIIPDLGTVKAELSAINATLVGIDGNMATVESNLGTIRMSTDAIHAKVTSIDDGVATVSSDLGTVKVKVAESGNQINVAALFAAAATIAASASAIKLYRRRPPKPPAAPPLQPPTEAPPPQSEPMPAQPEKQIPPPPPTQAEKPSETPKPAETPPQETPPPAEAPQETPPAAEPPAEQPPQTQSPPDSTAPKESPPQVQPEPQSEPTAVIVLPEQPVAQ